MKKHLIVKVGLIAIALVLGAGALRSPELEASGYLVSMGRSGEPLCEPGGGSDCGSESVT